MENKRARFLGTVTDEIVTQWDIRKHVNKPIIIYPDREEHAWERHKDDFECKEDYELTVRSLEKIIRKPDYVFYDEKKAGLEFYKNINFDVMVAVWVETGKVFKVRSFYPVTNSKIENRKKKQEEIEMKSLIEQYTHKDDKSVNV